MAEMVLAPSRGDGKEENFIQKFGRAFVRGDAFTKAVSACLGSGLHRAWAAHQGPAGNAGAGVGAGIFWVPPAFRL